MLNTGLGLASKISVMSQIILGGLPPEISHIDKVKLSLSVNVKRV